MKGALSAAAAEADDLACEVRHAAGGNGAGVEAFALEQRGGDRRADARFADGHHGLAGVERIRAHLAEQPVGNVPRPGDVALVTLVRLADVDDLDVPAGEEPFELSGVDGTRGLVR